MDDQFSLLAAVGEVVVSGAHVVVGSSLEGEDGSWVRRRGVVQLVLHLAFPVHSVVVQFGGALLGAVDTSVEKQKKYHNEIK